MLIHGQEPEAGPDLADGRPGRGPVQAALASKAGGLCGRSQGSLEF